MTTLVASPAAIRVWFDDAKLWVELQDGRLLGTPLGFYPRLLHATPEQRARVEMSGGGTALHWDEIDEDLSVAGLLEGGRDDTRLGWEHRANCEICRASAGLP
jgi:hypothetical protein